MMYFVFLYLIAASQAHIHFVADIPRGRTSRPIFTCKDVSGMLSNETKMGMTMFASPSDTSPGNEQANPCIRRERGKSVSCMVHYDIWNYFMKYTISCIKYTKKYKSNKYIASKIYVRIITPQDRKLMHRGKKYSLYMSRIYDSEMYKPSTTTPLPIGMVNITYVHSLTKLTNATVSSSIKIIPNLFLVLLMILL